MPDKITQAENRLSGTCVYCGNESEKGSQKITHKPECNVTIRQDLNSIMDEVAVMAHKLAQLDTPNTQYDYELDTALDGIRKFVEVLDIRASRRRGGSAQGGSL